MPQVGTSIKTKMLAVIRNPISRAASPARLHASVLGGVGGFAGLDGPPEAAQRPWRSDCNMNKTKELRQQFSTGVWPFGINNLRGIRLGLPDHQEKKGRASPPPSPKILPDLRRELEHGAEAGAAVLGYTIQVAGINQQAALRIGAVGSVSETMYGALGPRPT
jgi:hypothetical protein